jgi:toxin FitB
VKYLVDVNVLSEGTKSRPAPAALEWLVENRGLIAINPIVLGELEFGIQTLPAGRHRNQLRQWLAGNAGSLPVLDIDANTGLIWATLLTELKRKGRTMPVKDSLIAATARQHGLTVATRNVDDYRYAGVPLVNPFEP